MNDSKSYSASFVVGQPLDGAIVAKVLKSNDPKFKEGDIVSGYMRWIKF